MLLRETEFIRCDSEGISNILIVAHIGSRQACNQANNCKGTDAGSNQVQVTAVVGSSLVTDNLAKNG